MIDFDSNYVNNDPIILTIISNNINKMAYDNDYSETDLGITIFAAAGRNNNILSSNNNYTVYFAQSPFTFNKT